MKNVNWTIKYTLNLLLTVVVFIFHIVSVNAQNPEEPALDPNRTIVSNFQELKSAIEDNNGFTTIYLKNDVNVEGPISIPNTKATLKISGMIPGANERSTLTETYTANYAEPNGGIYLNNAVTKQITLEDINIKGRNYYGPIVVYNDSYDVSFIYRNVKYNGPQLTYNLNGHIFFEGDNDLTIEQVFPTYSSLPQEVAETKTIHITGNFKVHHNSDSSAMFWMGLGANSPNTFTVGESANVDIIVNGNAMFYRDGTNPIDITIQKNANVKINTTKELFRNTYGKGLVVESGAKLELYNNNISNANPMLWLQNGITVMDDASLIMKSTSPNSTFARFLDNAQLDFYNPRNVLLYSEAGAKMFTTFNNGRININTKILNYWDVPGTGDINDIPRFNYSLPSKEPINISLQTNGSTSTVISSNIPSFNTTDFIIGNAKVISMGNVDISLSSISDRDSVVTGVTTPDTNVVVSYNEDGQDIEISGTSDQFGNFSLEIPKGFIKPYTSVSAKANNYFKTATSNEVFVEDITPPEGDPVQQIISIGDPFPTDAKEIVTNVRDHSDGTSNSGVSSELIFSPPTDTVGPTYAIVKLIDQALNSSEIKVPVLIKDENTSYVNGFALRSTDFEIALEEIRNLSSDELNQLILSKSNTEGWDIESGELVLNQSITVQTTNLDNTKEGNYSATIGLGDVTRTINIIVNENILKFNNMPSSIGFKPTIISANIDLIHRDETNWDMTVYDSRGLNNKWMITASIDSPMTSIEDPAKKLTNALVFKDENGTTPLSSVPLKVFEHTTGEMTLIPIEWENDKGILLKPNVGELFTGTYTTTINWTLIEAP